MKIDRHVLSVVMVLCVSLAMVALTIGGCAVDHTSTVAVAVETPKAVEVPKPPIPDFCDPATRKPWKAIKKTAGDQTKVETVEQSLITNKKRDSDNADREAQCFCWATATYGSDTEKSGAAGKCAHVASPAQPAPVAEAPKPAA